MAKATRKTDGKDPIALEAGRRIADCRKAKGWTQRQLAQQMGWREDQPKAEANSPSSIGMYEQGRRRPALEEARVLSRLFPEYPPAYFMGAINEREARVLTALGENPLAKASPPARLGPYPKATDHP